MTVLKALMANPSYTLMRGIARFSFIRKFVVGIKRILGHNKTKRYQNKLMSEMKNTIFKDVDLEKYMSNLHGAGCGFGLRLPSGIVEEIRGFAESNVVYAFRDPKLGFLPNDRAAAEAILGKQILLAQYFNVQKKCPVIPKIALDPMLNWIALNYIGCVPKYLGAVLWWTYPINPNRDDQLKHAHFFHRDIDDFKFLKFFFYITDVEEGDGGHWLVSGSHKKSPHIKFRDHLLIRRFEDKEIMNYYNETDIIEVFGSKGLGFAEDTLCVHKAATPSSHPRLILQLQFGLYDFVSENDNHSTSDLQRIY